LPDICPEMKVRAAAPTSVSFQPSVIPLLPLSNMANLKTIVCNIHGPVLLRLLACWNANTAKNPGNCPYPDHKNNNAIKILCCHSPIKLAQVYFRHEQITAGARSCVIVFIEGFYLKKTNYVFNLLLSTVQWLGIAAERPYFYIFSYGPPQFGLTHNDTRIALDEKIKGGIAGYSENEAVCFVKGVSRTAQHLILNYTSSFSVTVS